MQQNQKGHRVLNFVEEELSTPSQGETSNPTSSKPLERHSEFFFDDTLVAIQVERTLFNVHKYQLVKSEVFSDMFKMPGPEGGKPKEGSSTDHPIELKGVSASDFATLLRVLYASHFTSDLPAPEASLIVPAFRLANMLNFSQLRTFLLPLAEENLDDVDKIVFAREFDLGHWLVPAHVRLCQREKPLNTEEVRKLGVESIVIISRMREKYQSRGGECGGLPSLRYDGPTSGAMAQANATTSDVDNTTVEEEIKKWEENGYTVVD